MDPSSLQQHQQMSSQSLENMIGCSKASQQDQRKARPQPEEALKCPRCESTNTKFCYYNNYSLSQPRYFCKSCRRYWTKGGTLRNVPVGGGCRKNKRSSSSSSSSKRVQDQTILTPNNVNNPPITTFPTLSYDNSTNDLNIALARLQKQSCTYDNNDLSIHYDLLGNPTNHHQHHPTGFLDVFRSGFMETQSSTTDNNIQSLYCGYSGNGDKNMGEVVDNGGSETMMMMPYDHQDISNNNAPTTQAVTVTTMKQEIMCSNGRYSSEQQQQSENYNSNNRVLWGLPWQLNNNNGDMNMLGGIESGRSSWNNNGLNSPWHGLLNSPLM